MLLSSSLRRSSCRPPLRQLLFCSSLSSSSSSSSSSSLDCPLQIVSDIRRRRVRERLVGIWGDAASTERSDQNVPRQMVAYLLSLAGHNPTSAAEGAAAAFKHVAENIIGAPGPLDRAWPAEAWEPCVSPVLAGRILRQRQAWQRAGLKPEVTVTGVDCHVLAFQPRPAVIDLSHWTHTVLGPFVGEYIAGVIQAQALYFRNTVGKAPYAMAMDLVVEVHPRGSFELVSADNEAGGGDTGAGSHGDGTGKRTISDDWWGGDGGDNDEWQDALIDSPRRWDLGDLEPQVWVLTCTPEFVVSMDTEDELSFVLTNINGCVPQARYAHSGGQLVG